MGGPGVTFSPGWKGARHFPRSRQGRLDTSGSGNFVSARAADSQPRAQVAPERAEERRGEGLWSPRGREARLRKEEQTDLSVQSPENTGSQPEMRASVRTFGARRKKISSVLLPARLYRKIRKSALKILILHAGHVW